MGRLPASITIETDDIRKTIEELTSRGVEFVSDVLEFRGVYVAQFQDPQRQPATDTRGPLVPHSGKRLGVPVAPGAAEIEHLGSAGAP
jgi:hypothetical protein